MGSVGREPEPERILKTDLREYSKRTRTDGPYADDLDIDVLIVGAGKLLVHNAFRRSIADILKGSAVLSVCTR